MLRLIRFAANKELKFPSARKATLELFESKLFLAVDPDFDQFCQQVLALPKGVGARFVATCGGSRHQTTIAAPSIVETSAIKTISGSAETSFGSTKLTRPVAAPVGHLEPHALANLLPMASEEELQSLRENIRQHGLLDHICLLEGKILDGRNRYKACLLECVEPSFEEFIGDDPAQFVAARNLHRRNLTTGQRAAIAAEFLPFIAQEAAERKRRLSGVRATPQAESKGAEVPAKLPERGEAREAAARTTGVSARSVSEAARIKRESPELYEQVKAGKVTLQQAKRMVSKKRLEEPKAGNDPAKPFVVVLHEDSNRGGDHDEHLWCTLMKGNEYPNVAYFRLCEPADISSIGSRRGFVEAAIYCVQGGIPSSNLPEHPYQRPTCRFSTLSIRGEVPAPAHVPEQCVSGGLEGVLAMIKSMWPHAKAFFISPTAKTPSGWEALQAESGSKSDRRVKS